MPYTYSIYVKAANTFTHIQLRVATDQSLVNNGQAALIRLSDGLVTATTTGTTATASSVGDDWWRISLTFTATAAVYFCGLWFWNSSSIASSTGNEGVYIWGAGLRVANEAAGLPVYQRVGNTSTNFADYDTIGFPPYLRFNGSDSWLSTASIDFTATDKMTVFAGVRKLSDSGDGIILELGTYWTVPGAFYLTNISGIGAYEFSPRGARFAITNDAAMVRGFASPDSAVLAAQVSLNAGTPAQLRRNKGDFQNSVSTTFGGGNFGNYPVYIGRRNGTDLPFNGRIYSLIIRGAQSRDDQITQTEKFVASKTGITL